MVMVPDAIRQACFDTWLDEDDRPEREEEVDAFAKQWGSFEPEALTYMLQEGNENERLFAIFALGHLAPADVKTLLTPLLSSPERKERGASAIALGRGKHECAFAVLQDLLLEDMDYHYPYVPTLGRIIADASEEAERLFGQDGIWVWEELVDPAILEAWNKQGAYEQEYHWYMIHRLTVARLFGVWGDPRAIPTLRQALRTCQELEQRYHLTNIHFPNDIPYVVIHYIPSVQMVLSQTLKQLED